jgi:hypothetical protein
MDGRHEGSFIKVGDNHLAVKGPSPPTCFTGVIIFDPGFKGSTANGTAWMGNFSKFIKTGPADRKTGPFRIRLPVPEEISADRAPGGINDVDKVFE